MASNHYKIKENNVSKTWFLMLGFLVLLVLIGWFFSIYYDNVIILYIFIGISIFMNFFSYWFSDKIVLGISGAKKADKENFYELYTLTENLAIASGLPMPKIYVIQDSSPNAFATGRNPNHSAIAVTTGLLSILERTELEGVIAHELAHIKNRDILLQTVVVVLVGLVALVSDFFIRMSLYGRGGDRDGKLGVILMIVGFVMMILSPIIASVIQLAISRKREFMADATGALMTRYPEGLANALKKISEHPVALQKANHATAHLYISDPFKESDGKIREGQKRKKLSFFHKIFLTHPPIEERIRALTGDNI